MGLPVCHFELGVKDLEKARKFYKEMFEWEYDWNDEVKYGMVEPDSGPAGGIMLAEGPMPSYVTIYIEVANVDEYLQKAENLGGEIRVPRTEIQGGGVFGVFSDPEGIVLGVYEETKK